MDFVIIPCVSCFHRPNSFVIITANRVIHCNTDTPEEMHHWIGLLQKSKGDSRADGQEFLVRGLLSCGQTLLSVDLNIWYDFLGFKLFLQPPSGWLHKEMKSGAKSTSLKLKKRWFVLTTNSLDYYKSSERSTSKLGTLVLNSLCSVVQPDEKVFKDTGQFIVNIILHFLDQSIYNHIEVQAFVSFSGTIHNKILQSFSPQ